MSFIKARNSLAIGLRERLRLPIMNGVSTRLHWTDSRIQVDINDGEIVCVVSG